MSEIRTEQLAFSDEEAASLLKNGLGLNVSPVDLRVLLELAEGWPAAIYPELLESQECKLRTITQRNGHLSEELTQREWAVLRLLDGELSTRRMGESLRRPKHGKNPHQIRLPQARSLLAR